LVEDGEALASLLLVRLLDVLDRPVGGDEPRGERRERLLVHGLDDRDDVRPRHDIARSDDHAQEARIVHAHLEPPGGLNPLLSDTRAQSTGWSPGGARRLAKKIAMRRDLVAGRLLRSS